MARTKQILGPDGEPFEQQGDKLRRWPAARTTRLNASQWATADGSSINVALGESLSLLRDRVALEIGRNPYLEGVVNTHTVDLIGYQGPRLQVTTPTGGGELRGLADRIEKAWSEFWEMPDLNGQLSGAEMLSLAIRNLWTCGEFMWQKVTDSSVDTETKMRLVDIHPRRLDTPIDKLSDSKIVMGIKVNRFGRPNTYYVLDEAADGIATNGQINHLPIAARYLIHRFRMLETGQMRGVPWAAVALQVGADLRDLDDEVLDAVRAAADFGVYLYTTSPEAKYVQFDEEVTIARRTQRTLPPHYQAQQVQPNQPGTRYIEYREERLAELGRPVNMPSMTVRLNAQDHNYSSARFDDQNYHRGNRHIQGWLERTTLNELVKDVAREVALENGGGLPDEIHFRWTWPVRSSIDPVKDANAQQTRLENGTTTYADECAMEGRDWEEVLEQRIRERDAFDTAGLPYGPFQSTQVNLGSEEEAAATEKDEDDEDED